MPLRDLRGYLEIDDKTVWGIVQAFVPSLQSEAQAALDELDTSGNSQANP